MDPTQPQLPQIDYAMVQAMVAAMAQAMQQYIPMPAVVQTNNFNSTKRGIAEPGTFDGSMAKYKEWVIKMTSLITGNYAQAKLDFNLANGNWPMIDEVVANLNSRFWPMNNGDWAWKKMQKARQGKKDTYKDYVMELWLVARNFENHHYMTASSSRVWPQNQPCGFSATGMQPGASAPMDIGAAQWQGKGKGPPKDKSHITCFVSYP
ncbi:hypothetical protein M404DRAFT_136908 [Pisolithus tinctorius Marx 270]|uniref:Retrotransposon gag domain-containing protein n=1 Tax=Pisolithus tinctorius Marx 270 TaxID=870435 RepID=A0A0C3JEA2_PISTI|nr:hypothetical protein M404DRAFT_136908 [Pisolithus tinctorius Marx 270]